MVRILLILLISSQTFAQTNIEKAIKLWEAKNNSEAKKILSAIDDGNKDYASAQFYLGRISVDENRYDDASDFFEEAVNTNDKVAENIRRVLASKYNDKLKGYSLFFRIIINPSRMGSKTFCTRISSCTIRLNKRIALV